MPVNFPDNMYEKRFRIIAKQRTLYKESLKVKLLFLQWLTELSLLAKDLYSLASLIAQLVKNLLAMQETPV